MTSFQWETDCSFSSIKVNTCCENMASILVACSLLHYQLNSSICFCTDVALHTAWVEISDHFCPGVIIIMKPRGDALCYLKKKKKNSSCILLNWDANDLSSVIGSVCCNYRTGAALHSGIQCRQCCPPKVASASTVARCWFTLILQRRREEGKKYLQPWTDSSV